VSFKIKVKVEYKEKQNQWVASSNELMLIEKEPNLPSLIQKIDSIIPYLLRLRLKSTNRLILDKTGQKVSISIDVDDTELTGHEISIPIEDARISIVYDFDFRPERSLDEFQQDQPVSDNIREIERKINPIAFQTGETPEQVLDRAQAELNSQKAGTE